MYQAVPHGYAFDGMKQRYVNGIGTAFTSDMIISFAPMQRNHVEASYYLPKAMDVVVTDASSAPVRLVDLCTGLGWQLAWFSEMAWQLLFQAETSWGITLCLASLVAAFATMGRTLFNMYRLATAS